MTATMQQQISLITLGIADLARSKRFYGEGFGWTPVFETPVRKALHGDSSGVRGAAWLWKD